MNITDDTLASAWLRFLQASGQEAAEVDAQFQARFSGLHPADDHVMFPPPPFDATLIDGMVNASRTVLACIASLPERVFGGDVRALLDFQGVPADEAEFLVQCCGGRQRDIATDFARPDCVITPDGLRMVEMNIAPPLGGTDTIDRIHAEICASGFGQFLASEGIALEAPETLATWTRAVRALNRASAKRPSPVLFVALADPDEQPSPRYPNYVRTIEAAGFRHRRGLIQDLEVTADGVFHHGERVDMVYTMFTYAEFLRFHVPRSLALALVEADKAGSVDYVLSPVNIIFDNKCNLELLTSPEFAKHWTPTERAAINRCIPLTRRWRAELFPEAIARRTALVLKPDRQFGGAGVVIGANVDEAAWRAALDGALNPGEHWILQDVVAPLWQYRPEPAHASTAFNVCLGPLFYRGEYGGTFMRLKPAVDDAIPVINAAQGASVGLAAVRRS